MNETTIPSFAMHERHRDAVRRSVTCDRGIERAVMYTRAARPWCAFAVRSGLRRTRKHPALLPGSLPVLLPVREKWIDKSRFASRILAHERPAAMTGVVMMMREMRNVVAVGFFLVRLCRERRLGKSDNGRRNNTNTHEVLHYWALPSLCVLLRESGAIMRRPRSYCDRGTARRTGSATVPHLARRFV